MFNHLQTFPNLCENWYLMLTNVIFWFVSPKRKTYKVQRNSAPFKIFKKYVFETKKLKNKQKL